MPAKADDPLRKVTLNLYETDVTALADFYGHGWSTNLREIIHTHVMAFTNYQIKYRDAPKTLGDLDNG